MTEISTETTEHVPTPVRIVPPTTNSEWSAAASLMAELKEWDVQQSIDLGFEREEVLSVFYGDDSGAPLHDNGLVEVSFSQSRGRKLPVARPFGV